MKNIHPTYIIQYEISTKKLLKQIFQKKEYLVLRRLKLCSPCCEFQLKINSANNTIWGYYKLTDKKLVMHKIVTCQRNKFFRITLWIKL